MPFSHGAKWKRSVDSWILALRLGSGRFSEECSCTRGAPLIMKTSREDPFSEEGRRIFSPSKNLPLRGIYPPAVFSGSR